MSCKPILNGVLWNLRHNGSIFGNSFPYTASTAQWQAEFDDMQRICIDKIMLFSGMEDALLRPAEAATDLVEFIATECDRRGMDLIVATGGHPNWPLELKMPDEIHYARRYVDEIHRRYSGHRCFAGWYIDYEFSLRTGDLRNIMKDLYKAVVEMCKEKTPALPVIASPFFNPPTEPDAMGVGKHSPQEYYEFWSDMIAYSHLDVICLQDMGGQHFSFFNKEVTEPYIAAYAKACKDNNCRFWGNVETGEFHVASAQAFIDKYGLDGNVNSAANAKYWRPVPIERLKWKLELMSQYSESNMTWGYQYFYRPNAGNGAYAAYKAYQRHLTTYGLREDG